jgi:hypothetical protein
MKTIKSICLLSAVLFIGGCAGNNVTEIANSTRIPAPVTIIDTDMEDVMTDVFTETGLDWDDGSQETILNAMSALKAEAEYMVSIMNIGSNVSLYDCKASVNRTTYLISKLKRELDSRVQVDGAVTKIGKYAYYLLVEKVVAETNRQKLNLATVEAQVNKSANAADLADLKRLYDTVAPLVKTAMVAL